MIDKQSADQASSIQAAIRRLTIGVPPVLWCLGFQGSLFMGCSAPQALLKATAYALSGLAGWLIYLLISRPSDLKFLPLPALAFLNIPILNPTKTPWPFPEMLLHSVLVSVVGMALMSLVIRLLRNGKRARPAGTHSVFDAELDPPRTGA